jgi:hypothetical protein
MIGRSAPNHDLSLLHLPAADSWEQLQLGGGFAIVNQDGLFVLDDWTPKQLDFAALRSAFQNAATLNHDLRRLEVDALRPILDEIVSLLGTDRPRDRAALAPQTPVIDNLLPAVARIGAELAKLRGRYATPHYQADARTVHDALDRQWGLTLRLTAMDQEVRSLETSLRSLSELRITGISRLVAIYGFALVLAATIADVLGRFVWWVLEQLGIQGHEPPWLSFGCFVAATALLSLLFRWRLYREDPLRQIG